MKRTVITFGLIAGIVIVGIGAITRPLWIDENGKMDLATGEWLGYATLFVVMSMIFFGIRQYRERYLNGYINFGTAFKTGLYITLIASVIYVLSWLWFYYTTEFGNTFPEQYLEYKKEVWTKAGKSVEEINAKVAEFESNKTLFDNPFMMAGAAFAEIFPVGLIVSLISALILKRRSSPIV